MGVWIETPRNEHHFLGAASHPAWVCGLKLTDDDKIILHNVVTPCVGVWIETQKRAITLNSYLIDGLI